MPENGRRLPLPPAARHNLRMAETGSPAKPQSPCISICTLDDDDVCMGCYRSLDEIVDWTMMSDDEKRTVLGNVAERAALRSQAC